MSTRSVWRNSPVLRFGLTLTCGLVLLLALLLAVGAARSPDVALAQGLIVRYVDCANGSDDGNDCGGSSVPCATIQHAVDVADPGDEIRAATGTCNDVQARAGITQVVYISKTVTLRGGYTTTNWMASYPLTQPTTLDAGDQGRVLYISGDISAAVEGLRITGGNATGLGGDRAGRDAGGGVYVITATVNIGNNWVFSNSAPGNGYGGGLFLFNSDAALSGNHVTSNTAKFGGGLYFDNYPDSSAVVTLTDNTVSRNTAETHAGGLSCRDSLSATLTANTISDNEARGGGLNYAGGARFQDCDHTTLIGNIVSGNLALNRCGGFCFEGSDNVTLESNIVMGNLAGAQNGGGGLHLDRSDATLSNNVIADNQAGIGGGVFVERSSARLLHTTIARNSSGDGSGVYVTNDGSGYSTVAMTNTILVSHTVGITVTAGNTATLNGVLWYSNTINYGGEGTITVTNAYTGDPAFGVDGYHLTIVSEAIVGEWMWKWRMT
jgi:hypothetical protein